MVKNLVIMRLKAAAELSVLNVNAEELNKSLDVVFKSEGFKSHFCFEADVHLQEILNLNQHQMVLNLRWW